MVIWLRILFYISSLLEIDTDSINGMGELLLKYIDSGGKIDYNGNNALIDFINVKGKFFKKNLRQRFLNYLIFNHTWRTADIIHAILESYKTGTLSLKKKDLDVLIFHHYEKCDVCDHKHKDQLFHLLYEKGNKRVKDHIKHKIELFLTANFKFDLYYLASIYKIIDFDFEVLKSQIVNYQVPKHSRSFDSIFGGMPDFYSPIVDQILNLAFQNKVDTKSKLFSKFAKGSSYYKWLLNMDSYNYSNFDINWALHYNTIYFLDQMSKSVKFKNYIRGYLKKRNHEGLERLLLKITNFNKI